MRLVVIACVVTALARPAAAQTARIAHLSHSGSVTELMAAGALDNFGIIPPRFEIDRVQLLSDTTALEYGRWKFMHSVPDSIRRPTTRFRAFEKRNGWGQSRQQLVDYYRERGIKIKALNIDSNVKPAAPEARPKQAQRKKSTFNLVDIALPQRPGLGPAVLILLLSGAGWLLGKGRVTVAQ